MNYLKPRASSFHNFSKALLIFTALTTFTSGLAFASSHDFNAGDARVCFDNPSVVAQIHRDGNNISDKFIKDITSVEAYDLYAAKKKYGAKNLLQPAQKGKLQDYGSWLINRISFLVPQFSVGVQIQSNKVGLDQVIDEPSGVVNTNDVAADVPYDTIHCIIATVATFHFDGTTTFVHIDPRLFDHPSNSSWSKAVLYLHEFVYMYARSLGAKTSKATSDVVEMMMRKHTGMTALQWIDFLYARGFGDEWIQNNLEKYLGLPGFYINTDVVELINLAAEYDQANYLLVEPYFVNAANGMLSPLGSQCKNERIAGCLEAIRELEAKRVPGAEKLASIKKQLEIVLQKKIKATRAQLLKCFQKVTKPSFDKLPYPLKLNDTSTNTLVEMFKGKRGVINEIINSIEDNGPVELSDPAFQKVFIRQTRKLALRVDRMYNLNSNPVENTH